MEFRSNQNLKSPKVPAPKANANGAVDGGRKGGQGEKGGKGGGKGNKETCKKCNKPGHSAKDCWSGKVCTGCKKTGHIWESCFTNPKSPQFKPPAAQANAAAVQLPAGLDAAAILASLHSLTSSSSSGQHIALANAAAPKTAAPPQQHEQWEEFQRYLTAQALVKKAYGCRADSSTIGLDSDMVLFDTLRAKLAKEVSQMLPLSTSPQPAA